jgi:hypothetical protein
MLKYNLKGIVVKVKSLETDQLLAVLILLMVAVTLGVIAIVVLKDLTIATAVIVLCSTVAAYIFGFANGTTNAAAIAAEEAPKVG